ncbi:hypothetical protein B0H67DRAFT_605333 [Lasiosphaeris hirsuta]|uniref:Uncharacterized protein n=1 Tax=Lasiosphaeris hirsuta TaxID=260670 RepID=A0AA40B9X6_9PEZI|nr:hypothetical protein B0H67DRAFT_605333 [Lasiosphaeris hirsuta]
MHQSNLEGNGIFIREKPTGVGRPPPPHVLAFQQTVVDMDWSVADMLEGWSDDRVRRFDELPQADVAIPDLERACVSEALKCYSHVAERAEQLLPGGPFLRRDSEWETFFRGVFLAPLTQDSSHVRCMDLASSNGLSRSRFYYESTVVARNRPWSLFAPPQQFQEEHRAGLIVPTPDWAAFIAFYDTDPSGAAADAWHPRHSIVGNLSCKTLEFLTRRGLESSTFNKFRGADNSHKNPSDCACFPWLVVEHAKGGQDARQCYVRAANSGSAAILMFRRLAKYTAPKADDAHIPPVVTMTTVAQAVKVWVTYSCNSGVTIKMDCIWEGDMTKILDLISLRVVLENVRTWAMRELRPWTSALIDGWNEQFPEENGTASEPRKEPVPILPAPDVARTTKRQDDVWNQGIRIPWSGTRKLRVKLPNPSAYSNARYSQSPSKEADAAKKEPSEQATAFSGPVPDRTLSLLPTDVGTPSPLPGKDADLADPNAGSSLGDQDASLSDWEDTDWSDTDSPDLNEAR